MSDEPGLRIVTKPPRPEMTRRRRFGLAMWHFRVAFEHLWAIVRGR